MWPHADFGGGYSEEISYDSQRWKVIWKGVVESITEKKYKRPQCNVDREFEELLDEL